MNREGIINKTMDIDDLGTEKAQKIIDELNNLIEKLKRKNLKISSWYGNFNLTGDPDSLEWKNRGYGYRGIEGAFDDRNFPWFLYWEIAWITMNNDFRSDHRVLDLGGSSSLFSYYLASRDVQVTTIDLQKELVDNANHVAERMGWDMKNYCMDIRKLDFKSKFDHITSVCVFEHLPMYDRVNISRRIKDLLVEGGKFSITFDYRNPIRSARINSPTDIHEQFVKPSGLKIRGNDRFFDTGKNYLLHPIYCEKSFGKFKVKISRGLKYPLTMGLLKNDVNDYTFGALFLENVKDE